MTKSKDKFVKLLEEFYDDESLSLVEFVLLSRIESLDNCNRGCFMSNEKLGKFIRRSGKTTANIISKLRNEGYIIDLNENNHGRRGLRVVSRENETHKEKVSRENETTFPPAGNNIPVKMKVVSRENEQSREENKNTLKDKGVLKETLPEIKKEKKELPDARFLANVKPSKEQEMYKVLQGMHKAHRDSEMEPDEMKGLESLYYKIRKRISKLKEDQGLKGYTASKYEVLDSFKEYCNGLDDWTKNNNFTVANLSKNYTTLRKKQIKNDSNNSNSVLKQVQNIPDYKIEKRKK